jgi:hypothetical protein
VRTKWPFNEAREDFPRYAVIAALLTPNFRASIESVAWGEAQLTLARCALIGYREGADAARSEIAKSIDPYSGEPLHFRVDSDGVLVFWSVGPDGIDDGGSSAHPPPVEEQILGVNDEYRDSELPLDIVWKLRLN